MSPLTSRYTKRELQRLAVFQVLVGAGMALLLTVAMLSGVFGGPADFRILFPVAFPLAGAAMFACLSLRRG